MRRLGDCLALAGSTACSSSSTACSVSPCCENYCFTLGCGSKDSSVLSLFCRQRGLTTGCQGDGLFALQQECDRGRGFRPARLCHLQSGLIWRTDLTCQICSSSLWTCLTKLADYHALARFSGPFDSFESAQSSSAHSWFASGCGCPSFCSSCRLLSESSGSSASEASLSGTPGPSS